MATVKQYNLAGLSANVELGKKGSYITGTANAINFYNANDELQKLSIANAVASNQAVTLAQLNAEAQDLVQHITVDVTHTSGTANIATIPAGSRILSVTVEILELWGTANNAATFIEVGDSDNGSRFIRSQDADVLRVGQYHSQYQYEYLSEGTLTYSVTAGGATAGSAIISVVLATDYALNTDTSAPAPTFAVAPAANTVNENANITFTVTTTDFGSGTLYWTAEGSAVDGANAANVAADLTNSSGTVSVTSNSGSFVISTVADVTTEGSEAFFVQLRTDSISGNIVATSSNVTISDTSLTAQWEPSALGADLNGWYDANSASNVIVIDNAVSEWRDRSTNGRHLSQTVSANRPTYDLNGLDGSKRTIKSIGGDAKWLVADAPGLGGGAHLWAITVVTMNAATGSAGRLLSVDLLGTADYIDPSVSVLLYNNQVTPATLASYRNPSVRSVSGTVILDTPMIVGTVYNGVNNITYLNGSPGTTVASTGNFASNLRTILFGSLLGRANTSDGSVWRGECSEIVMGNTELSTENRQRIEGYLAHKWDFSTSLPDGHPYKASPP
jgi:hypothetical protein